MLMFLTASLWHPFRALSHADDLSVFDIEPL